MKQYDPLRVLVHFRGTLMQGFASGSFIKAMRKTETFTDSVGAGGDVVRVRSHDQRGEVTLTLQAASSSNKALTLAHTLDEKTGVGTGTIQVVDLNGNTLVHGDEAWVRKPADAEYGVEAPNREWTIDVAKLEILHDGDISL